MLQTHEVISPERAVLFDQNKAANAPKAKKIYTRKEMSKLRQEIAWSTEVRLRLKEELAELDQELKDLRQQHYEAQLQHAPITVLPPAKFGNKKGQDKKAKMSNKRATEIINLLLKEKIINQEDLDA